MAMNRTGFRKTVARPPARPMRKIARDEAQKAVAKHDRDPRAHGMGRKK